MPGGRNAVLGGAVGRFFYPVLLMAMPLFMLAPVFTLVLAAAGVLTSAWFAWSGIVVDASLLSWAMVYRFAGQPGWYAVLYPLGLLMVMYIAVGAIARGQRVEWKDRAYLSR